MDDSVKADLKNGEQWSCPTCGNENTPDREFCEACDSPAEPDPL